MDRDRAAVLRDVRWGKVSATAARSDYGVVITGEVDALRVDNAATDRVRAELREQRAADQPFFDRGPGYARLSGGKPSADVDHLA